VGKALFTNWAHRLSVGVFAFAMYCAKDLVTLSSFDSSGGGGSCVNLSLSLNVLFLTGIRFLNPGTEAEEERGAGGREEERGLGLEEIGLVEGEG
jgi:hypothetical protein